MFRYTIRDVLLVTVIAALAAAWGIDRWRLSTRAVRAEKLNQSFHALFDKMEPDWHPSTAPASVAKPATPNRP